MEYRTISKLNISPSLLGFGCMRFPMNEEGGIDRAEAEKMLDLAIKGGVNYIDTAYPYHGGESELFTGQVLKKYPRDSFYLATKLPMWEIKTREDAVRIFDEQLKRLGVQSVDFYMLHALNRDYWKTAQELDLIGFCEQLREEGKIKYIGFSFHDDYDVFEEILTAYPWDFCQIQYNYVDTGFQAGDKGYALAEQCGIPVIVMEPVRGGSLASPAEDIMKLFRESSPDASAASWALRWAGSKPGVMTVLSGMSTLDQVEDNLKSFRGFCPLDADELQVVASVAEAIRARTKNGCTGCKYCMPCPAGVNIPTCFRLWNEYAMYQNEALIKWEYYGGLKDGQRADACIDCGQCEKACPQALPIRDDLKRVTEDLPLKD